MDFAERTEKLTRALLWLVLASGFVLALVGYATQSKEAERLQSALRKAKAETALAEAASKAPKRIALDNVQPVMFGMDVTKAEGRAWFSNVSAEAGVICARGTATNVKTGASTRSLAGCAAVSAYASAVELSMMFADTELTALCPERDACTLDVTEP